MKESSKESAMRSARVSPNEGQQNPVVNGVKSVDNVQKIAVLPDANANNKEEEVKNGNTATYPKSILRKDTRYPSRGKPSGFVDFLQRIFNPGFDSPALERTYRHYFSGQKFASLVFLVVMSVVLNFVLIIVYSSKFEVNHSLQTKRIIISVLFLILNGIVLFLFICCRRRGPSPIVPRLVWISLIAELILNVSLNYTPLAPTDSVDLFIFFIYLTYSLLPFRLYSCIVSCLLASAIHIGITGAMADANRKYIKSLVRRIFLAFILYSIFPLHYC